MIRKSHIALAAAALIAAPAFAAPTIDANVELDSTYQNNNRGINQSGRVELNAFSKSDKGGGFVAGRASFLANKEGAVVADDMWVQLGNASGDVKLGRFEAADLFPAGKDVIVEDGGAAAGYRANAFRGRKGSNAFHAAVNVNAAQGVSFELGLVAKSDDTAGSNKNYVGVRPVVSFAMNGLSVKAGLESGKNDSGAEVSGGGVTVGTTFEGVGLNVNFASGKVGGVKGESFGVNATFGQAGVGYIMDKNGSNKDNAVYAAYSLPLFETGATITPAVSYAKGTNMDKNIGLRVRINYAF